MYAQSVVAVELIEAGNVLFGVAKLYGYQRIGYFDRNTDGRSLCRRNDRGGDSA